MLLAVFSDAHGNQKIMRRAVETRRPDQVIFLGDGIRDAARANLALLEQLGGE